MADNNISFEVQGLKELEQALLEIGQAASAKALFPALMAAGLPIQKEAEKLAPISDAPHYRYKKVKAAKVAKTGNKIVDKYNRLQAVAAVKGKKERILVQPGNLRKNISRKRLKGKKYADITNGDAFVGVSWRGNAFYGRFIEFGTSKYPAKPFLRPAFDAKKEEALTIFKQKLADNIEKQRQKIAQRTQSLS